MIRQILILTSLFSFSACGGSGTSPSAENHADARTEATLEPCDIITEEFVRGHFEIAADSIAIEPSTISPHPLCDATWDKPNKAELEEEQRRQAMEYGRRMARGEKTKLPVIRMKDQVSLTLPTFEFDGRDEAITHLDQAMGAITEGRTTEVDGEAVETPTWEIDPVEGLGEKAVWIRGLNELVVVTDERQFSVSVKVGDDAAAMRAAAMEIAREVEKRL